MRAVRAGEKIPADCVAKRTHFYRVFDIHPFDAAGWFKYAVVGQMKLMIVKDGDPEGR